MTTDKLSILTDIIRQRRTTKPDKMNGQKISDAQIQTMLEAADWAPNHGNTEPWRYKVYAGDAVADFCKQHADLYRLHTAADNFIQGTYDRLFHLGDLTSLIIIGIMQRGTLPKIPVWEEMAAVSCSIQNILLTATAMDIASFWSTGGMALHHSMKDFLHLREEDHVAGILYLGYTDVLADGKRNVPLEDKVSW